MRKGIVAAAIILAGVLAPGTASGFTLDAVPIGCDGIQHTQTYRGWGPASHYEQTVTVVFTADACTASVEEGLFSYELTGSAVVYAGEDSSREPIGAHDFLSGGRFTDPEEDGWPPDWWACDVAEASVTWEMPGVYTFAASADDGAWTLDVTASGATPVHWEYSACP